MRFLFLTCLLLVGCGEELGPLVIADAGAPCPGYGRLACQGRCVLACLSDDAGVWELSSCNGCGHGLSIGGASQ